MQFRRVHPLAIIVVVLALIVSAFLAGYAYAEPAPKASQTGGNAARSVVLAPVPAYISGGDVGVAVLAQEWRTVSWWEQVQMIAERDRRAAGGDGMASVVSGACGPGGDCTPATSRSISPGGSSGTGDCYGGPVPDAIVTRESGGNPYIVNPSSGAYGCYQLMPMHYSAGGTCADLDRSIEGQKACASRLPSSAWGY